MGQLSFNVTYIAPDFTWHFKTHSTISNSSIRITHLPFLEIKGGVGVTKLKIMEIG